MLSKIDYKILFELDYNSRQSLNEIAKNIGTSKQVVGNHLKKMLRDGYIKKFLTILDLSRLGLTLHKLYIRLTRTSVKNEEEIIDFLKNHKNVVWLARTEGIYDIAIALHSSHINELNNFMREFENNFGRFISERIINRIITGEFIHRDYLSDELTEKYKKEADKRTVVFQTNKEVFKLDDVDKKILSALCVDARASAVDISKNVKISADAIGKRIKNLEKNGVIKNYITVLDTEKMKKIHYKVLIRIYNMDHNKEKAMKDFCKNNKYIIFYNRGIGSWEVEIDMDVDRSEEFRNSMRTIKLKFADSIKDYFSLIIYDVVKFNFFPMYLNEDKI